jgi:DNA polymerase-3 subunit alpha
VVLDDRSKRIEVSLFSEVFQAGKEKVVKDAVLVVEGEIQPDDYTGELKMRADKVYTIEEARRRFARELVINCCDGAPAPDFSTRLKTCLEPFRDGSHGCASAVMYQSPADAGAGARGRIVLGRDWAVAPCDDLLLSLRSEFGDDRVAFRYAEN